MQQETEKELNSQIKKWGKTLRNEEPVIVEENQKQNWQMFFLNLYASKPIWNASQPTNSPI